jgi:hypothetical protein
MIIATANRRSYRLTPRLDKLVLEFDATIVDTDTELEDSVVKQIVISETLDVKYSELEDQAIALMAQWEIDNTVTGE